MKVVPLIILANFFLGIYTNLSVWYKLIDKTYIFYISIVGAIITLALNFLLIPTMSYYGSAIATIAAYGSMMSISYYLGNKYYPIPYDLKKIGAISRYPHFFSRILLRFQRELLCGSHLLIVSYILSITMKSNADENYKKIKKLYLNKKHELSFLLTLK
jgi:O-antigen/teichoic acid export membrane protein